MATLLLEGPRTPPPPAPVGTATLVLVLSPVRAPDGSWRVRRLPVDAGQTLAACLPARQDWERVIWNGAVVPPESWEQVPVQDGDEIWAVAQLGEPISTSLLLTFAIGLAVSIAATALSYVLFPPSKPHMSQPPDEHTFSFAGIQTAIGPGNVVPVIYGTHRVGGQLLGASVEQSLQVLDRGPGGTVQVSASAEPPKLSMLIALGEGPIETVDIPSIEINGQIIGNYTGVEIDYRVGWPEQPPMPYFTETRNTFADGRQLPDNSSNTDQYLLYTTSAGAPVTAVVLNIVFNEGLFNVTGKGEKEDNTVNVAYRLKLFGDPNWPAWSVFQVSAQRTAPVRFGIRREDLPLGQYDIAVNYGGVRHSDELKAKWKPTLESVTEIQAGTQTYPNTALLGLRAVATDTLQGALPNVTVIIRGKRIRIGTFDGTNPTWTDNPAWCVLDFLTNSRYGLGIPDAEIDLFGFGIWSAYCDEIQGGEPRHKMNYVLDRDARAQSLLLEMMGGSRTLLLKAGGLWTPRPTRNDVPVQLLSWATCSNLRITYTRDPDRINVMEARFANEEAGYQQDVMTWPPVDQWPAEVRKASMDIRGVTKPSRIQRALQFELNRRMFENLTLEFDNALDATTLTVHDLFRFSHPLPGWGQSGRVQEGSTTTTLFTDAEVQFAGPGYHCYLRHNDDTTEVRPIASASGTRVQFAVPFSAAPMPRDSLWAIGVASPDQAARIFRVVQLQRKSDTTVHIQAVVHNPSIYDEPIARPIDVPPGLPNPLGPPPPLTYLSATELTRVQPSGASLRVAHLAWDVAPLSASFAPYWGSTIYRRSVLDSSLGGSGTAGSSDLGAIQNPQDQNIGFLQINQVGGNVMEVDDYTVITGGTYIYRVVPLSQRGVPNMVGAREAMLHIAGPTTADFFPGTPRNLRIRGKVVGDNTWEGRDVHLLWDPVDDPNHIFNETFFVADYLIQIWLAGQGVALRYVSTTDTAFSYTYEMNIEDMQRNNRSGGARDLLFIVWAHTNTNRISLDPAQLRALNPPPDMSSILPECKGFGTSGIISWTQWAEPLDMAQYEIHLDTVNPPIAIYQDIGTGFVGKGINNRKVLLSDLVVGATYYTYILPWDTFGPGLPSQTNALIPPGLNPDLIDTTPPKPPTGLTLTTGTTIADDGTVVPWVEAHWTRSPDSDVAAYNVQVRLGEDPTDPLAPPIVPTTYRTDGGAAALRFDVPGGVLVRVRIYAEDHFSNVSPYEPPTGDVSITPAGDTVPPGPDSNLVAISDTKSIHLLWTPPSDADYAGSTVWEASVNNWGNSSAIGNGLTSFEPAGFSPEETRYYWVQPYDRSGNYGTLTPSSTTNGVSSASALLVDEFIGSLGANKIIAGTISALVGVGVAGRIFLDGVNDQIALYDQQVPPHLRVLIGRVGEAATHWGINMYNAAGQVMIGFDTGVNTNGIADATITAPKIHAGAITAQALVTDVAVITTGAQIAAAIIDDAKITSLVATKLVAGTILVPIYVGQGPVAGRLQIDGVNGGINVYDELGQLRMSLGRVFPTADGYGINIFNRDGATMWTTVDGGVTTVGIQNLAVTNAKIANASIDSAKIRDLAVVNAHIDNLTIGTGKIQNNAISGSIQSFTTGFSLTGATPIEVGRITFPEVHFGDIVWLIGTAIAVGPGAGGIITNLNIRENDAFGAVLAHGEAQGVGGTGADPNTGRQMITVQAVYPVTADWFGRAFVLESTGINFLNNVVLVGLRLQK